MKEKDREIRLERKFNAPRERVFEAWTEPEKISQWWGPEGFSTTTKEMNCEVGGEWIFTMHGPDGKDYPNHIVYTEIQQPEHLEYDHYGHRDEDQPHFKSTIVFEELDGRTRVNMRMLFPTTEKRDEAAEFGAIEGGNQTLDRLAEHLASN
jgi:uncharacterized protein YndB with AHSA1/START domain